MEKRAWAKSAGKGAWGVAAGHKETAETSAAILRDGGNAVDAALAAMAAACVSEPVLCSPGGGGFLLARSSDHDPILFDFFAQTPKNHPAIDGRDFHAVTVDFGTAAQEFHIGLASIAVPGFVHGLFRIHERLGRTPLRDVLAPAIELARQGVEITAFQRKLLGFVEPIYLSTAGAREIFAGDTEASRLPNEGAILANPDLANFFDALWREGPALFYEGEVAQRIADDSQGSGAIRRGDLRDYRTVERAPLVVHWRGADILTNPAPSVGGIMTAHALSVLDGEMADITRQIPAAITRSEAARRKISIEASINPRGTTHISVIDGEGAAVAVTLSNGEGSGYVVPGTGIMMNNMLGEEDLHPHGFHAWPRDRRMGSMMTPTIMTQVDGATVTALGSGGSNRIRTAVLQVLINLIELKMDLIAAVDAPRLHIEEGRLDLEPGLAPGDFEISQSTAAAARQWDECSMFFGGVHVVRRGADGGVAGAGDTRRGGVFLAS